MFVPTQSATIITEEEREDLELARNPRFIAAMEKIVNAIEVSGFDFSKVKQGNPYSGTQAEAERAQRRVNLDTD